MNNIGRHRQTYVGCQKLKAFTFKTKPPVSSAFLDVKLLLMFGVFSTISSTKYYWPEKVLSKEEIRIVDFFPFYHSVTHIYINVFLNDIVSYNLVFCGDTCLNRRAFI